MCTCNDIPDNKLNIYNLIKYAVPQLKPFLINKNISTSLKYK